jgi:hypothetical protein
MIIFYLQTLKIGKVCGDDGITHQMLKGTSETICIPLAIIFNFSLQKGIFILIGRHTEENVQK